MAKDDPSLVAGDHRTDGAGAEVLGEGRGGGLRAGHRRQGNLLQSIFRGVNF